MKSVTLTVVIQVEVPDEVNIDELYINKPMVCFQNEAKLEEEIPPVGWETIECYEEEIKK